MSEELPDEPQERPRFLLPDGCKDLIDVLRRQERPGVRQPEVSPAVSKETLANHLAHYIAAAKPVLIPNLQARAMDEALREILRHLATHGFIRADAEAELYSSIRMAMLAPPFAAYGIFQSSAVSRMVIASAHSLAGVELREGVVLKTIALTITPQRPLRVVDQ